MTLTPHCRRVQIDVYIGSSIDKFMTLSTPHYKRVERGVCIGSCIGKVYDLFDPSL
jgi:hypothetical protein